MMKAATRTRYGSPGVLSINTPGRIPHPKKDEILVKVKATTVNRTDCSILTGKPWIIRCFVGLFKPRRPVTGTDFSGIVVAKGEHVTSFDMNDDVYGFFDQGISSHASYVCVSVTKAVLNKPGNITYEQAAASLEGAHYAFYFLDKVTIREGDKVLVNGGTGAIGNAALQFLKYRGAVVTVTCPTAYVEALKSIGADRVVDYTEADFTDLNEQFDFIFDAVGKSSFGKCRRILKSKGVYISSELGRYWQNPILALLFPVIGSKKVKFPVPGSIQKSMAFINELVEQGKFTPLIDRRYSLEEIAEAFTYVLTGQKKGNVIVSIA